MVVGMPGGGGPGPGPARDTRDYDFDATAEEVPVNPNGHDSSRELPPIDKR
jgi:hypothetical protein